jgi:hypothetical protein
MTLRRRLGHRRSQARRSLPFSFVARRNRGQRVSATILRRKPLLLAGSWGERSEHLNRTPAPIVSRVRAQVSCSRSTINKIMTRVPSARSTGPTFPIGRRLRNSFRRLRTFRSFRAASPKKVLRIVSPLGSRLGHRATGNERTRVLRARRIPTSTDGVE